MLLTQFGLHLVWAVVAMTSAQSDFLKFRLVLADSCDITTDAVGVVMAVTQKTDIDELSVYRLMYTAMQTGESVRVGNEDNPLGHIEVLG